MSTKLTQPKNDSYLDVDGWVFPNYDQRKFEVDPIKPMKEISDKSLPINSFEFQQSIFGQYRYFYHAKMLNNIHKQCLRLCIRKDNLLTNNLTQEDKLCARECLINEHTFAQAHSSYIEKIKALSIIDTVNPIENIRI